MRSSKESTTPKKRQDAPYHGHKHAEKKGRQEMGNGCRPGVFDQERCTVEKTTILTHHYFIALELHSLNDLSENDAGARSASFHDFANSVQSND